MSAETRPLTFGDMRLTRTLQDRGHLYASIDEYAQATGMSIQELLEQIRPATLTGDLAWETVGGQAFLLTRQPDGRPRRLPPNLWEQLRRRNSLDSAYQLWRLGRDLEDAGWQVDFSPEAVAGRTAALALPLKDAVAPLLLFPEPELLLQENGPLGRLERAGHPICAIACRNRQLDRTVTAVRTWMLDRSSPAGLVALVLEEPLYQPLRIDHSDGSLQPRSSSIDAERRSGWRPPSM